MQTVPKLYLLPGMGASSAMYQGPWRAVPGIFFLDWPAYRAERSLADVAARVMAENQISPADWIGGSSLGGMVALEVAKRLRNPKIVLLGSALCSQEVVGWLRFFSPLACVTPFRALQSAVKNARSPLLKMYAAADVGFVRTMCRAVMDWPGAKTTDLNVLRIHGRKDRIITCPDAGHVLEGAGHLIAMTHAPECLAVIEQARRNVQS